MRRFLSHEWQDVAAVSRALFDGTGVAIKPERLLKVYLSNYPDIAVDGVLIRRVARMGND